MLGDESKFDFEHCNESFCSEKNITYDAPAGQINLILEKSPKCTQDIIFECKSTPINVSWFLYKYNTGLTVPKIMFMNEAFQKEVHILKSLICKFVIFTPLVEIIFKNRFCKVLTLTSGCFDAP